MDAIWIPTKDIPTEGLTLSYGQQEQYIWTAPIASFELEYTVTTPITATITLQTMEDGCFVSGTFNGSVLVPCGSCLTPTEVLVGHLFEDFIAYGNDESLDMEGNYLRISPKGLGTEIHVSAILWEEFFMDCSGTVRCNKHCLGICPDCGINKNTSSCSCLLDKKDPRLEKLHALALEKK